MSDTPPSSEAVEKARYILGLLDSKQVSDGSPGVICAREILRLSTAASEIKEPTIAQKLRAKGFADVPPASGCAPAVPTGLPLVQPSDKPLHPTGMSFEKWLGYQPYHTPKDSVGMKLYMAETVGAAWMLGAQCVPVSAITAPIAPPTEQEIAEYRNTFSAELHRRMDTNHPSASPSTESHSIALRQFVRKRNEGADTDRGSSRG